MKEIVQWHIDVNGNDMSECDAKWDGDLKNPTVKHVQMSNGEQMNAEARDGH